MFYIYLMKIISLLLICSALVAADHHHTDKLITREGLEQLRSIAKFDVLDYEEHPFKDMTLDEVKSRLGCHIMDDIKLKPVFYGQVNKQLPESFDARTKWNTCIHPIRDQGNCGSCWAFAASEVLTDRFCIVSSGKIDIVLSPQDLVSCDDRDTGCKGGYVFKSWDYLKDTGIVSDECLPYTSGKGDSGTCPFNSGEHRCTKGEFKKYKASGHKHLDTIEGAKENLFKHGPIEAAFIMYDDLLSYKGGVYRRTSEKRLGGHLVKIIGWGKDDVGEYWLVANSWGTKWGENGTFRIGFGECGFEEYLWAGQPDYKTIESE
jgi:cathepsin B